MTGAWLLVLLLGAIVFIVVMTARVRLHPFLVLLLTTLGVGLLAGVPAAQVVSAMTSGFGSTLGSIGIVIAAGTIMGYIMEKSGAALVMANSILKLVGQERSALAMAVTGGVVSIPVFCDSGFVILSPLNRSLAARSKQSLAVFAVALSMGLYSTHVFVPPTPGPIAAAGTLGADLGTVILLGLVVSVPTILAGYIFAKTYGARVHIDPKPMAEETGGEARHLPSAVRSFAPIVVPVVLIALKSVADYPTNPLGAGTLRNFISFVGNPNVALLIGVFLAFLTVERLTGEVMGDWVSAGLKDAGMIILITGAGASVQSFEKLPSQTTLPRPSGLQFGILLPSSWLLLSRPQGSSTVAIITTAGSFRPS